MKIWEEKRLALLNEIETVTTEKAAMETELKQQQETLDKLVKLAEKQRKLTRNINLFLICGILPEEKIQESIWNALFWERCLMQSRKKPICALWK